MRLTLHRRVNELEAVLVAFREATHCDAAVWSSARRAVRRRRSSPARARASHMPDVLPDEPGQLRYRTNDGTHARRRSSRP